MVAAGLYGRVDTAEMNRARNFVHSVLAQPWIFALAVMAAYALLLLPALWRAGFDPSGFIVAGDMYVARQHGVTPIIIRHASAGYDGQFYYRLALAPFNRDATAFGVGFDETAKRMRRTLYPLIVHIVTFSRPRLVPSAMVLVNLCGVGAVAACAVKLANRLTLPAWFPVALVAWPGFLVTLTHDTTEITAAACLIAAIYAYVTDRLCLYVLLGAAATLARETSLLALLGILAMEAVRALRLGTTHRQIRRLLPFAIAPVPYLVWRTSLSLYLGPAPPLASVGSDIGWPLQGAIGMLLHAASALPTEITLRPIRIFELLCGVAGAAALLLFCAATAVCSAAALRDATLARVAAAWLPIAALMSLLTAAGPWIEPTSFFRAFTECYVIGLPLYAWRPMPRPVSLAIFGGGALSFAGLWLQTLGHIR